MRLLPVLLIGVGVVSACGEEESGGPAGAGGGGGEPLQDGGGGGDAERLTCLGVIVCFDDCGDDTACQEDCYEATPEPSWDRAFDLATCLDAEGCDTVSGCDACAFEREACILDGTTGLDCPALRSCRADCGADPEVCGVCELLAQPGAADAADALDLCVAENGCTDEACVEAACAVEQDACEGGG